MSGTGESRSWGTFIWRLFWISVFACAPAYFAWVTNNSIKPYFEERGMGSDAAHTGLVLASCIMHAISPTAYQQFSGALSIVALVFDCLTAKYAWEWRQMFEVAGETVLAQNCLALFIIAIIGLALEAIVLGLVLLFLFTMGGTAAISEL
ncbi:hypothetical protein PG988_002783 [Apiospora saccharicola]